MCEKMYRDAGYVEHIPNIFICAGYAAGGKDSCEVRLDGLIWVQWNLKLSEMKTNILMNSI